MKYSLNKIKELISRVFLAVSFRFKIAAEKIYTPQLSFKEKAHQQWLSDRGDLTKRLFYPLNKKSLVFDFGGYEGDWASNIYSMYESKVYIFEPVGIYYSRIKERFRYNSKIKVYPYGLSNSDKQTQVSLDENSSSAYKQSVKMSHIKLRKFSDFIIENRINYIDLMKLNIEGGEYDLLDEIIASGYVIKVENIQVQFHDFVPNAHEKMRLLHKKLAQTHQLTYQYPWVWENWSLKVND